MLSERTPHFYLRLSVLMGELSFLYVWLQNLLPWVFEPHLGVQSQAQFISVVVGLCYVCCVLWSGIILHQNFVRADQILRRFLGTQLSFAALSLTLILLLWPSLLNWRFLLLLYTGQTIFSFFFRWMMHRFVKWARMRAHRRHAALFVGEVDSVEQIMQAMTDPTTGYQLVGYVSREPIAHSALRAYHLGTPDQLDEILARYEGQFDELYSSLPSSHHGAQRHLIDYCDYRGIRFFSVSDQSPFRGYHPQATMLAGVPIVALHSTPLENADARISKRAFDLVFSALFLVALFPFVLLVFGPWIKFTSPGPIFFKQRRSGLNGHEFWCYKFRSMRPNAQADQLQATLNDPRTTFVGRLMRRTNIDELPQFINVLLGDMSVVGPRPHMVAHTEQYGEIINKYRVRHMVRPGITGYAQVSGFRGETKELWQMEERVKRDLFYIEHWSFALDLWIIVRTLLNTGEKMAY